MSATPNPTRDRNAKTDALMAARANLASRQAAEVVARRAAYAAEEATRAAGEELAVAMVAAGVVPLEFRLCDSARLWLALRTREGVETAGGSGAHYKSPGPGFMRLYIGLAEHWIPARHYFAWSDEVEKARKAAKEAGK